MQNSFEVEIAGPGRWRYRDTEGPRLCAVAAAVIGSAVVTGVVTSNSADKASESADKAIQSQAGSADAAAQLGRDQLAFDKQVYSDGADLRKRAGDTALKVTDAQLASQQQNDALAQEYADYNRTTFRPIEQKIVADSQNYDTPDRRLQAANEATANVESSFGSSMDGLNRSLQRQGVTPGSGRSLSLMADGAYAKAKAVTGATSTAVKGVETTGFARMADAANLGRGLPSSQATSAGIALNAGNSAVANGMQGINAQTSGAGLVNTGYSGATSATLGAGSLYGQSANLYNQQASTSSAALGALGSIAGQYAGSKAGSTQLATLFASDKDVKSDTGKPIDTAKALQQVVDTPVDEGWKYDAAKGGPDDGGQRHDGPMAQSVRKTMGEKAAPGGKVIDIVTMNGKLMAGMQEINKRLGKLERKAA